MHKHLNKMLCAAFAAAAVLSTYTICAYAESNVIDNIDFESGTQYILNNLSESIGIQNSDGYLTITEEADGNKAGELTTYKSDGLSNSLMSIYYRDLPNTAEYRAGFRFNHTLGAQVDIVPVSDGRLGYIRMCEDGGLKIVVGWGNLTSAPVIECSTGEWHTLEAVIDPVDKTAVWYLDGTRVAEYSYSAGSVDCALTEMTFQAMGTEAMVRDKTPVLLIDDIEAEALSKPFRAAAEANGDELRLTFSEYPAEFDANQVTVTDGDNIISPSTATGDGKKYTLYFDTTLDKGKSYTVNLPSGITSAMGNTLSDCAVSLEVPPEVGGITAAPSKQGGIFTDNREIEFSISAENTGTAAKSLLGRASVITEDGTELWSSGEISLGNAGAGLYSVPVKMKPRWNVSENQYGRFYIEVGVRSEGSEVYASTRMPFSVIFSNGVINQRMGQSSHYSTSYNTLLDNYDKEISLNTLAGFGVNREEFQWDQYEKTADVYALTAKQKALLDSLANNGLKPMLILYNATWTHGRESGMEKEFMPIPVTDYQRERYAEYIKRAVADTSAYAPVYELGNEWDAVYWNKAHTWADGSSVTLTVKDHYIPMMKTAYEAIKSVNIDAQVIGLAVSAQDNALEFIEECLENGAADYCDMISIHPYSVKQSPEEYDIRAMAARVRDLLSDTAKPDMPIVVSEWGWTSAPGRTSEETQAMYSVRGAALLGDITEYLIWYCSQETDYINSILEQNFGLINFSQNSSAPLAAKPVYIALSCFNSLTGDKEPQTPTVDADGVYQCRYEDEKERVILFWSPDGDKDIQIPDEGGTAILYDMYGNRRQVKAENGVYTLTAGEKPCYLVVSEELEVVSAKLTADKTILPDGALAGLENGTQISFETAYTNGLKQDCSIHIILAAYDKSGRIVAVDSENITATAGMSGAAETAPTVIKTSDTASVKGFVWTMSGTPIISCITGN